ncbi:hypothetical protein M2474_000177 [Dysgonomonas sp. PH5-37]|nr:hypothetical protein [Dysgonomonas sp. PH5-37]
MRKRKPTPPLSLLISDTKIQNFNRFAKIIWKKLATTNILQVQNVKLLYIFFIFRLFIFQYPLNLHLKA